MIRFRSNKWAVCASLLVITLFAASQFLNRPAAHAQSGSRYGGSGSRATGRGVQSRSGTVTRAKPPFETRFWEYLQRAQYRNWAPVPGQSADAYPGQSPHGVFLKMYLNRTAAGNLQSLPHGSILIKENYGPDGTSLMAVTVMYKAKGYDPKHNDWYWIKYNPDGTVARTPPEKGSMSISGRFPSCIDCHSGAEGNDYAFANDQNKSGS